MSKNPGLASAVAGNSVQLRWRFGRLTGVTGGGWFIDTVTILDPLCLPPVTSPMILDPARQGNVFSFAINTVTNPHLSGPIQNEHHRCCLAIP
ncbi:MAG: hypothetical protein C5B50_01950 [Verrucomicrobia bacterium]|nr:MAG: hypothetical protein C5B50_01950 [Verrucomicrobiota bacterium]